MVYNAQAGSARHRLLCRHVTSVTLDGVPVSLQDCIYADTRRGVVRVYARNANGSRFVERGNIARVEHRGKVRVRRRRGASGRQRA